LTVTLIFGMSATAAWRGFYGWALVWAGLAGICCAYFYLVRSRIPFASVMLEASIKVVARFPALFAVAYAALVVQLAWLVFWTVTWIHVWPVVGNNAVIAMIMVSSLFWTAQVIKNVVHVTASGVAASWYFLYDCLPRNPTCKSLSRTLGISMGSICLGSLITSFVKALRTVLDAARKSNDGTPTLTVLVAALLMRWLDLVVQYFNVYAFTHVAVYGKPYVESAKDTYKMLKECGVDAILNDDIVGGALLMGSFLVACMTGFVGGSWAYVLGIEKWFWGVGLPCAFLGFILGICTMNAVESACVTIYVCFAEDPDALFYNDRKLYNRLADAQELGVAGELSDHSDDDDFNTSDEDDWGASSEESLFSSSSSESDDDLDDIDSDELEGISSDEDEEEVARKEAVAKRKLENEKKKRADRRKNLAL